MPNYNFREIERCLVDLREGRPTRHNVVVGIITEKLDLNTSLGHVVFVIISAIAQLERDLIAERVRNGLAAAKARGAKIGRVRTRNSALIESLLDAGISFRNIARIAKCSHGSVSAQKKEWLARKNAEAKRLPGKFVDDQAAPPAALDVGPKGGASEETTLRDVTPSHDSPQPS